MWSRVRHRRLQAVALVSLAALLTTSLCLGPLYQRAMEQALAGSSLAAATPQQRAVSLTSTSLSRSELEGDLPEELSPVAGDPIHSSFVPDKVTDADGPVVATRLYTVDDACARLEVVAGSCPEQAGEAMVSKADAAANGWGVGSAATATERLPPPLLSEAPGTGTITVVGVYEPPSDLSWLGAPLVGRAGTLQDEVGLITDDWIVAAATVEGPGQPGQWLAPSETVSWPMPGLDVDELVRVGPAVAALRSQTLGAGAPVRVDSDLAGIAERVAKGRDEGRTTVVVLVSQLLVLVAVVLWMVLVAATDDRRAELALARLRGRGRRGAAAYLLSELVPLTFLGVVAGVLVAPFAMTLVARVVFPVAVPRELPDGFLLAALGSAVAVLLVVLAAARRAVREPVDSLLRAVPARHTAATGAAEATLIVFSLTAVVALATGALAGPLATLAPTLLAVAVGLLLGRALTPLTRVVAERLLRSGRAVAAAGIVSAVRRPSARRILVMVVVASALLVFCVDALVTGQHNRENAAEQANGARYVLVVQPTTLQPVVDAVAAADPSHRHLSTVVTTSSASGGSQGPTVAVDPTAFRRLAYFPLSPPRADDWEAIRAPGVEPLRLQGETLAGAMQASNIQMRGPSRRYQDVQALLQVQDQAGDTQTVQLATIPRSDGSVSFSVDVPCADGCVVTGLGVTTPPSLLLTGSVVFTGLTVDGQPFSLGRPEDYRRTVGDADAGSVVPAADLAGNVGETISSTGAAPPIMFHAWVPQPVPALVTTSVDKQFEAPGLSDVIAMSRAGRIPRVPGAPPGARAVDVTGLVRRPDAGISNDSVEVWSDDARAVAKVRATLADGRVVVGDLTTVDDVRAELDASPAAWSLALSVLVGTVALLVAMLVIIVATATTWRSRATDLAALRMAGLPGRSLRRMELLGQLPVVVVGAVAGAGCGMVAAVMALPDVRQFTDTPAVDTTDFSTPWATVLVAAAVALLLLNALAVATSRWTARRAPLSRIREVV